MSVQIERRIFTVAEYHRMADAGILSEDDRVELIDGEIVKICPIGTRHVGCVNRLNTLLVPKVGQAAIVSVQNPVILDDYSEPESDIALLKPRADFYSQSHATPQEVFLIIEIAETSVSYDRGVKLRTYGRAGIPEVWIADLPGDAVEAHSDPMDGKYRKTRRAHRGEILTPERLPAISLSVDEILG